MVGYMLIWNVWNLWHVEIGFLHLANCNYACTNGILLTFLPMRIFADTCGYGLFATFRRWIHTFQCLETFASGIWAKLDILAHADICGYMRIRTFWSMWHVDTLLSSLRNLCKWKFGKIGHLGTSGYMRIHADTCGYGHVETKEEEEKRGRRRKKSPKKI